MATERPTAPVPDSHVPTGGTRHVVQNNESWESLARGLGIDPWDLIDYNFPGTKQVWIADQQKATRYVNWYLSEYIGCQVRTPRGNYKFTSGLRGGRGSFRGGVVFLPPANAPAPTPTPTPTPRQPPPCEMRDASFFRLLNPPEWDLVRKVFGGTLPPREEIGISDGLGDGGRPWTYSTMLGTFINFDVNPRMTPNVKYVIELGNLAATDLTSTQPTYGPLCANFERISDLFIHEMTHVWHYRYHHELRVLSGAYYAQRWGAGYEFTPGQPWKDYNFEQQAHIVETWYQNGMRKTKDAAGLLYPYVNLVVRAANKGEAINYSRTLPLDKLWEDQLDLQRRGRD